MESVKCAFTRHRPESLLSAFVRESTGNTCNSAVKPCRNRVRTRIAPPHPTRAKCAHWKRLGLQWGTFFFKSPCCARRECNMTKFSIAPTFRRRHAPGLVATSYRYLLESTSNGGRLEWPWPQMPPRRMGGIRRPTQAACALQGFYGSHSCRASRPEPGEGAARRVQGPGNLAHV